MSQRSRLVNFIVVLFLFLSVTITISLLSQKTNFNSKASTAGRTYYVSKNGNNSDGLSWTTAWNELNQINWSVIQPGDTILLDGGTSQMVYVTSLTVSKSGMQLSPITIKLASDTGRNGQAVLFGGRSTALPYCAQSNYTPVISSNPSWVGIDLSNASWVVIDGTKWRGIDIHGHTPTVSHSWEAMGIVLDASSSNDTIRNTEIYDNGIYNSPGADQPVPAGTSAPDDPGIKLKGGNLVFERDIIHDNGQDAYISDGVSGPIRVSYSWLYNSRPNPQQPSGVSFNSPCTHEDGMQIYNGGVQAAGIEFDHTIFGPGLMQGVILSDSNATVQNVSFSNDLFIDPNSNGIFGGTTSNWTMQNITSFMTSLNPVNSNASVLYIDGSGMNITDSVLYGGNIHFPVGSGGSGNCQFNTYGNTSSVTGQTIDPIFTTSVGTYANTVSLSQLSNTDFSLQPSSPCASKGSTITSVANLLSVPDPLNPNPTMTIVPTLFTPTATPVPVILGDINDDSKVDLTDLSILSRDFGKTSGFTPGSDLNYDGRVDLTDLSIFSRVFPQS